MGVGNMIGPLTLTVGQPFRLDLAPDTAYVEIQNDSLNDIWVYYGEVQPTDITNANKTWHRVVRRQHNGLLPTVGYRGASAAERQTNTIGDFKGRLWLLSVNPAGLAATGTITSRNQVYVTPYAIGDALPRHSSLSTQSDITSEPRVIAVPVAATQSYVQDFSYTALGAQAVGIGPFPEICQQVWDGNTFLPIYLYSLSLSSAAASAVSAFQLQICERNSSHVVTATYNLHNVQLTQNAYSFTPATPFPLVIKPALGTLHVTAQLNLSATTFTFGTMAVSLDLAIDVDQVNQQVPPPIGGGSKLYNLGGIPSGTFY